MFALTAIRSIYLKRSAHRLYDRLCGRSLSPDFNPSRQRDLESLFSELGLELPSADELEKAKTLAADRVHKIYQSRYDVRESFPLGLTPGQLREFATWLFRYGKSEYGLTDREILAYLTSLAHDPSLGLIDTYTLTPEWQRAVPTDCTSEGWDSLKHWLKQSYPHLVSAWLYRTTWPCDRANPPPTASPQRDAVNILGQFRYASGIQIYASHLVAAAKNAHYHTYRRDIPVGHSSHGCSNESYLDFETADISLIVVGAGDSLDLVYRRAGLHPRSGVYRIACWAWELEVFPSEALAAASMIDEAWVISEYCARSVRAVLPNLPVKVMHPPVDIPRFATAPRSRFNLPEDRFLFLFMFDFASGIDRKNPFAIIEAYRRAFSISNSTHLAIKVSRSTQFPDQFAKLQAAARGIGATIIDGQLPRSELWSLLNSCDCYISLHRSEGFGYTLAEAIALGKPTIGTAYSGNLDFMSDANSLLVSCERVELKEDAGPYAKGSIWAEPSIEDSARKMRWVYDHPTEAKAIASHGRATIAAGFTLATLSEKMAVRLAEIRATNYRK